MICARSRLETLSPSANPEQSSMVTPVVSKPSVPSWASTAPVAPSKVASRCASMATRRPSTSVMVLSEVFRDTDRTSARGADSTEASSEASEEAAPRVTSPVTATPAAVSWSEKAFAASIAGSLG